MTRQTSHDLPVVETATHAARRERREQRRAVQRAQNLVRAQQMRTARLCYEGNAPTAEGRLASGAPGTALAYVGCSGWYYRHWECGFYPAGLPGSKWFQHYADNFGTVELNAPFYSWPSLKTVQTWKRQVAGREFMYTIKVNELITHTKRFLRTDALVKDFSLIADLLGDCFGCFLFQLPPSFRYSPAALKRIVRQLDPRYRNVVEFRHRSWWNEKVFRAFSDNRIIFCSTSSPRLPDVLVKTGEDIYIRFHGTQQWYRHDYTEHELSMWTARILTSGATRLWAYFNNDREGYAVKNARELRRQLVGGVRRQHVGVLESFERGC